ncbi:hypothetical protein BH10ACI4_BH10ACI4_11620 [soil metagenome]
MTKSEILQKLGTNAEEWESYLEKTAKFLTNDLTEQQRELHKRLYSDTKLPTLTTANADDIRELFESHAELPGQILSRNHCGGKIDLNG